MRGVALAILSGGFALAQVPDIRFDGAANFLKPPANVHLGEAAGVATDSKGNIFVYTRTGSEDGTMGGSRFFTHGGSRLFEFDATGKYLREIGVGIYGFMFAQAVRIDAQDNIWTVDRGANVVIKFDSGGRVLTTFGRKPESVNPMGASGRGGRGVPGQGIAGDNFNRPTDVAWDAAGNIFVSDAYTNARVVKLDKAGRFVKTWGSKGSGQGQFDMPNSIAVDAQGNVYVADLGNKRIQVFDNDGTFKTQIGEVGAPWAVCISPGAHQYLYSSNSNPPDSMDNGEIYKMELDGKILGKFGTAGKMAKEFGTVNEIDCRNPNQLYVGELTNWRVQKLTLHP
ncbi:MAG TPA: peptidyl-alpha-hydroxyglycine alpha-amidating lyase family protein [Bryobacteraceae bacterium]|jgi:streptogramin lyase|nr:peptidyl-alpha-hydroxyglycine alpha-amidating lyase family protein [Bryobacteraceae bacterium]